MTKKELEQKVINATTTVEKRRETLRKHRAQLQKKIEKGAEAWEIHSKEEDIKGAERKLDEAEQILKNWKDKLGERISRDAFIEANAPEVIKDFLEKWKLAALDYYRNRRAEFIAYRDSLRKAERAARLEAFRTLPEYERMREIYKDRQPDDGALLNLWPREPVADFLRARGLDYKTVREKLAARTDAVTDRLVAIRDEAEREEWLEKTIEEEKNAKLVELISRINKVVGTITDASGLSIGGKGDINGLVIGTEGRATIETIGVAGYNIVCFHYRTLIHELKGA